MIFAGGDTNLSMTDIVAVSLVRQRIPWPSHYAVAILVVPPLLTILVSPPLLLWAAVVAVFTFPSSWPI